MSKFRKAWVAGIALAVLAALDAALVELPLTPTQQAIVKIAAVAVGVFATWRVPNEELLDTALTKS